MSIRFAADIGGTFTDVVLDKNGLVYSKKLLTTYEDPANAVISGLDHLMSEAALEVKDIELVLHGTTLATNALLKSGIATTRRECNVHHLGTMGIDYSKDGQAGAGQEPAESQLP